MLITECIILAGGLGTRLRSAVPDLPKCMAPVAGKPFIHHLVNYLQQQGVTRYIFSLGYMQELVTEYIHNEFHGLDVDYSVESEPLGTGGAILLASNKVSGSNVLVMNGDTLFKADISMLSSAYFRMQAACTLALKPMKDFDRYGVVELDEDGFIKSFKEKQFYTSGLINGGVYALNLNAFTDLELPQKFSFEKDYLEKYYYQQKITGIIQDEYFIDIGVPEDYERAEKESGIYL